MPGRETELLEAIFAASPDAVIVVDEDGRIRMASAAVEDVFGYGQQDLVGQPVEVLLPEDARSAHLVHRRGYAARPVTRPMGVGLDLHGRRRDGTIFPVDISLAPVTVSGRNLVGAFVRDATARRRTEDLLRHVNEISHHVLAGGDTSEALVLAARRARQLVSATLAWIVVPGAPPDTLVVAAADGEGADALVGATLSVDTSLSARAMDGAKPVIVDDMVSDPSVLSEARAAGLGPGIYLPMLADDGPVGALVLARATGAAPFVEDDVALAEVFGSAAAVVLSLGSAREELEELRFVSEHERIARDLHDTVIQRLFALGIGLASAERRADAATAARLRASIDGLDAVIREIRETIFDLSHFGGDDRGIRQRVRRVADESADQLGFSPRVAIRGPVDAAVSDEAVPHLLSVLREALSNVARHAHASAVDVVVEAANGSVTLTVADDGVGIGDGPSGGQGLANMSARAAALGGVLTVGRRHPQGTVVQWRVSVSDDGTPAADGARAEGAVT